MSRRILSWKYENMKIFTVYKIQIIYNYRLHFTHKRCVNFT